MVWLFATAKEDNRQITFFFGHFGSYYYVCFEAPLHFKPTSAAYFLTSCEKGFIVDITLNETEKFNITWGRASLQYFNLPDST